VNTYYTLFFTALAFALASMITVYFASRSPLARFFLDEPDKRKMHQLQIPRIGGFAFLLAYGIVMGIVAIVSPDLFEMILWNNEGKAIGFAAIIVFILGFFDDSTFVELTVAIKFGAQFIIAIAVVYLFGISFEHITIFGYSTDLGEFGRLISVFWIVGVTNALNIIDGIDGLSASVTLVVLAIAAVVLSFVGQFELLFVLAPVVGVILGFLYHNYPPARLFAGDTGSLFFGSVVAIVSVTLVQLGNNNGESLAGFYIAAFPVLEVFVSMFRRFIYGQRKGNNLVGSLKLMVSPDNLHMHHRLIFKGFSHVQALRFLVFFAGSISFTAIILVLTDNTLIKLGAMVYSFFMLIMVLRRLDYGKSQFTGSETGETIRRVVAITGDSDYFEHSLRHYSRNKYWIARFQRSSDIMGRRVDAFIVYNECTDNISLDIQRALDIRKLSERALFFITDLDQKDLPTLLGKDIYFIKKPVDMAYLIHDMEIIITLGDKVTPADIDSTLSIEGAYVTNS